MCQKENKAEPFTNALLFRQQKLLTSDYLFLCKCDMRLKRNNVFWQIFGWSSCTSFPQEPWLGKLAALWLFIILFWLALFQKSKTRKVKSRWLRELVRWWIRILSPQMSGLCLKRNVSVLKHNMRTSWVPSDRTICMSEYSNPFWH